MAEPKPEDLLRLGRAAFAQPVEASSPAWDASTVQRASTDAASSASTLSAGASRPADTAPPRAFGRYQLLVELGRGGMGVVWKAWDPQLERHVALKLIRSAKLADEAEIDRFLREARSAARLRHPNIVSVHDVGEIDGQHYFTCDFVDGESLEAARKREQLPSRRALSLVKTVAEALHYAHGQGIVHRDIKPANILLDREGRPYVTDFGLAKEVGTGSSGPTLSGEILGTPAFMSPEQASGRIREVGPASDQWSLGVTLYVLLCGVLPFNGEGLAEVVRAIQQDEPIPPRTWNPKLHPDAQTILQKTLEKDPRRRYASLADLAADLGRHLDGEPIAARPVGRIERWKRKAARHPRTVAVVGVGALLGLAGLGYTIHAVSTREHARGEWARTNAELARVRALSDVLRRWNGHLEDLRELDAIRHDVRFSATDRARRAETVWSRLRGFESNGADDPEVRAVARAFLGWARWLGGARDEGVAMLVEAREAAPSQPYPTLLLALIEFVEYVEEMPNPATRLTGQGQRAQGPPRESDRMRERRGRMESLLAAGQTALDRLGGDDLASLVEGMRALQSGEAETAARAFSRALDAQQLKSFEATLRRARAMALWTAGDFAGARADLDEIARGREGDAELQRILAAVLLAEAEDEAWKGGTGRAPREEALRRLDQAIAWAPSLAALWDARGFAKIVLSDLEGALSDLDRAVALDPSRASYLANRSFAHLLRREWALAIADADAALRIDPGNLDALVNRAAAHWGRGHHDPAVADAERALALDPENVSALNTRALVRQAKGDLDAAIADLDRAVALSPRNPMFRLNRGLAHAKRGNLPAARADLDEAVRLDPSNASAWNERGILRLRLRDHAGAEGDFGEAIRRSPRYAVAYNNRGYARLWQGRAREALGDFEAACSIQPSYAEALNGRGWTCIALGESDKALADFEEALAARVDYADALHGRARARLTLGEVEEALSDLERALTVAPREWTDRATVERLRHEARALLGGGR